VKEFQHRIGRIGCRPCLIIVQDEFPKNSIESTRHPDRRCNASAKPVLVSGRQLPFELVMRRAKLFAGTDGGFQAVSTNETEYQMASVPEGVPRDVLLRGPVVLSTCARCHSGDGIFSINSYSRRFSPPGTSNPQLLPAMDPAQEDASTVNWKIQQFDWGLLRGLLEAAGKRN
jgi:hypothetical protein